MFFLPGHASLNTQVLLSLCEQSLCINALHWKPAVVKEQIHNLGNPIQIYQKRPNLILFVGCRCDKEHSPFLLPGAALIPNIILTHLFTEQSFLLKVIIHQPCWGYFKITAIIYNRGGLNDLTGGATMGSEMWQRELELQQMDGVFWTVAS